MNGDPVLFAAVDTTKGATYSFACLICGRHQADQPDTACAACAKPARSPRRPTRKTAKR